MLDKYRSQGLEIVAPTQRYGFIGRRRDVGPDEELQHILETRDSDYGFLRDEAVPVSEASHKRYGVSTTPTVVLVDRLGIVRLYHPGQMTEAELEAAIRLCCRSSRAGGLHDLARPDEPAALTDLRDLPVP